MKKYKIETGLKNVRGLPMSQIVYAYGFELVGTKDLHLLDRSGEVACIVHFHHGVTSITQMEDDSI